MSEDAWETVPSDDEGWETISGPAMPEGRGAPVPEMSEAQQFAENFGATRGGGGGGVSREFTPMAAEMQEMYAPGGAAHGTPPTLEETQDAVVNNLDVIGGVGGSILGSAAGPAGTVAGGAAGTFVGNLLTDYFKGDDADFTEATKEAAVSAGIDLATLGVAKYYKPVARALGIKPEHFVDFLKKNQNGPSGIHVDDLNAGEKASLKQTQDMLEKGFVDNTGTPVTSSLTAFQAGETHAGRKMAESLAATGVFSRGKFIKQTADADKIIANELNKVLQTPTAVATENMAEMVHGAVRAGDAALSDVYDATLTKVGELAGDAAVDPKWALGVLKKFRKEGAYAGGNELDDGALALLGKWETALRRNPGKWAVKDLMTFKKVMNQDVRKLADFGSEGANKVAAGQLAEIRTRLASTIQKQLDNVSPEAGKLYSEANAAYSKGKGVLLPEFNAGIMANAKKGDFESLSRLLTGDVNVSKIKGFMNSIDEAYAQASMAGVDMSAKVGARTATEAKDVVRQAWMKNLFSESAGGGFVSRGKNAALAQKFEIPKHADAARAVLGKEGFTRFKQVLNAMEEVSRHDTGMIGSLVLRSKEAAAAGKLAGGAVDAVSIGVLSIPGFMAKVASSPKAVRRLVEVGREAKKITSLKNLTKEGTKAHAKAQSRAVVLERGLGGVISALSEEDRQEIRDSYASP